MNCTTCKKIKTNLLAVREAQVKDKDNLLREIAQFLEFSCLDNSFLEDAQPFLERIKQETEY